MRIVHLLPLLVVLGALASWPAPVQGQKASDGQVEVSSAIQHDVSALVLVDLEARRFRVHVLSFANNESFIEEGSAESECCTKSPCAVAIATRKPVVFIEPELKDMCSESPVAKRLLDDGVKVFGSVPLVSRERALGALNVGRRRHEPFSAEDVELLGEFAKQISIAVDNAHGAKTQATPTTVIRAKTKGRLN